MTADISALPKLPDPETLTADANSIVQCGNRVAAAGSAAKSTWAGIQSVYASPEEQIVYAAMGPVVNYTDEVQNVTTLVSLALVDYANKVRELKPEYDSIVSAASMCYADSTPEDPDFGKNKDKAIELRASKLATQLSEAEKACADAIRGADPVVGTPPGVLTGHPSVALQGAAAEVVSRLSKTRLRVDVSVAYTKVTLDVSHLHILFADGSKLAITKSVLTETTVAARVKIDVPALEVTKGREALHPPAWAKGASKGLVAVGIALTVWDTGTAQWNEDQKEHPEWDTSQRIGSAAENVALEGGLGLGLGTLGAVGGAALGQALIPIPGVGAFIGGAVGGWLGTAVGTGLGAGIKDLISGHADSALEDTGKAIWKGLFG